MHLSYAFVIVEHVFGSPFQNSVFFTVICENPASQKSVDENGRSTLPASCSTGNILRGRASHLFSCLLPRGWEVTRVAGQVSG